jgi:uncharacterized phage infection (PIP) family protein YhgE
MAAPTYPNAGVIAESLRIIREERANLRAVEQQAHDRRQQLYQDLEREIMLLANLPQTASGAALARVDATPMQLVEENARDQEELTQMREEQARTMEKVTELTEGQRQMEDRLAQLEGELLQATEESRKLANRIATL